MSQRALSRYGAGCTKPYELESFDWTFRGANTTRGTHGIHEYPARMIPQIPGQLLEHWLNTNVLSRGDVIYDPFCGSGTTVVEARKLGFCGVGTDINPFACLLARAKATPVSADKVAAAARDIFDDWHTHRQFIHETYDTMGDEWQGGAPVKLDWFPKPQVYELDSMARRLSEARSNWDHNVVRFLRICLAAIVRKVSYQQNGEFKRQRIAVEERDSHNPDVWMLFSEVLAENLDRLQQYQETVHEQGGVDVRLADCRSPTVLDANSVDGVLTSPPYGDSATTVAYGQYSRSPALASTPLHVDTMRNVDPEGLGGSRSGAFSDVTDVSAFSESLRRTLTELESVDGRRDDALSFFADFFEAVHQLARVVKPEQPVGIVVGNRTMSRVPVPMHLITEEFLEATGFTVKASEPRSIPSKTLPWENAPKSNTGETGELIADEYVIAGTAPDTPTMRPPRS
jgi:site-specific DNA-methyltransferase (cytosine-N4-specific)